MGYREKLDRINNELVVPMQKRYAALDIEISFLEASIDELPEDMTIAMHELVIDGFSWEEVAANLYISITKLQKLRRAASYLPRSEYTRPRPLNAISYSGFNEMALSKSASAKSVLPITS